MLCILFVHDRINHNVVNVIAVPSYPELTSPLRKGSIRFDGTSVSSRIKRRDLTTRLSLRDATVDDLFASFAWLCTRLSFSWHCILCMYSVTTAGARKIMSHHGMSCIFLRCKRVPSIKKKLVHEFLKLGIEWTCGT